LRYRAAWLDHEAFLGSTAEAIAAEKAGIAKPGSPLVTMEYPASIRAVIMDAARHVGAELRECGSSWTYAADERGVWYQDDRGSLRRSRKIAHEGVARFHALVYLTLRDLAATGSDQRSTVTSTPASPRVSANGLSMVTVALRTCGQSRHA